MEKRVFDYKTESEEKFDFEFIYEDEKVNLDATPLKKEEDQDSEKKDNN